MSAVFPVTLAACEQFLRAAQARHEKRRTLQNFSPTTGNSGNTLQVRPVFLCVPRHSHRDSENAQHCRRVACPSSPRSCASRIVPCTEFHLTTIDCLYC